MFTVLFSNLTERMTKPVLSPLHFLSPHLYTCPPYHCGRPEPVFRPIEYPHPIKFLSSLKHSFTQDESWVFFVCYSSNKTLSLAVSKTHKWISTNSCSYLISGILVYYFRTKKIYISVYPNSECNYFLINIKLIFHH